MRPIDRGAIVIGLLFIAAGTLFLLEALDVFTIRTGILWPVVLIGFGLGVALGGRPATPDESAANEFEPPFT